jgi:type III secretory pathway component EscR
MKIAISNLLLVVFLLVGCGKKSESMSNEEKISGQSEKTWKATRETTAEGEKDKLTREEKKESITFSRNGNVKMSNEQQVMGGTWSFVDNTLSLQFTGTNVTENFKVLELSDDKIKLLADDGSQMILEPN